MLCATYSSVNDYIRLLAEAYKESGHEVVLGPENLLYSNFVPDIVHLHWPEQFYKTNHFLSVGESSLSFLRDRLDWFRSQGASIVYTVHNLFQHETLNIEFERQIYRLFALSADVLVHHGQASVPMLKESVPETVQSRHLVVPHGAYAAGTDVPSGAREAYGLPPGKLVLLNFGLQRRYKGAKFIESVFAGLDHQQLHLFTIGPLYPRPRGLMASLRRTMLILLNRLLALPLRFWKGHTRIWRDVPNTEVVRLMAASDIVVLGHQHGLNSGLLAQAASHAKPIIYPDIGNFREQLEGWTWAESYEVGNVDSAVAALGKMTDRLSHRGGSGSWQSNADWLERHTWGEYVSTLVSFCSENK